MIYRNCEVEKITIADIKPVQAMVFNDSTNNAAAVPPHRETPRHTGVTRKWQFSSALHGRMIDGFIAGQAAATDASCIVHTVDQRDLRNPSAGAAAFTPRRFSRQPIDFGSVNKILKCV